MPTELTPGTSLTFTTESTGHSLFRPIRVSLRQGQRVPLIGPAGAALTDSRFNVSRAGGREVPLENGEFFTAPSDGIYRIDYNRMYHATITITALPMR